MNTKILISTSAALFAAAALLPVTASAEGLNYAGLPTQTISVGINASTSARLRNVIAGVNASTTVKANTTVATLSKAKTRADQEITRRITNVTSLSTRVGQMKNLVSSEVSSLQASISSQINTMNALKAKIDADTDLATLKTDVQSITKDYRIYMLILPQGRVTAAADRVETVVSDMNALETKLQERITAAQSAGQDISAAVSANADLQAKVADANTQAQAAANEVVNLQPDQGNATLQASNTAAVKDAAAKIKTALADLKAARADVTTILKTIKGVGLSGTASSTASVNAS